VRQYTGIRKQFLFGRIQLVKLTNYFPIFDFKKNWLSQFLSPWCARARSLRLTKNFY